MELINHYTASIGHEGIQCYQYVRVIKVLLKTHISAGLFRSEKEPFKERSSSFPFLLCVLKPKEKEAAQKCMPTNKSKHLFPLDIQINAGLAVLTPRQGH